MGGLAADMRAGEVGLLAQEVDQQGARLDQGLDLVAVELELDRRLRHGRHPCLARACAAAMARRVMTPATWVRNSAEPRPSAAGRVIASAALGAPPIAARSEAHT